MSKRDNSLLSARALEAVVLCPPVTRAVFWTGVESLVAAVDVA
jgi:hypothetical protein